jgi:parallel beta-helix repeat protein
MSEKKLIPIENIDGIEFYNLFYDYVSNQFYLKNDRTQYYRPILWRNVYRHYTNKDGSSIDVVYKYLVLNNHRTKQKLNLKYDYWQNNRNTIIANNVIDNNTDGIELEEYKNDELSKETLDITNS